MKKIKSNIFAAVLGVTAALSFSACDIEMLPLNDVVYENYWTEKQDVESMVTACYGAMRANSVLTRMIAWGESRSDNVQIGDPIPTDLRYLMRGSIKTTNSFCDWGAFYTTINYCNVVMHEAPAVLAKDPNYTNSDYKVNIAECSFIRDYMYLTLIKTFRDVPFTLQGSIDDTQNYRLPQTKFEDILDQLIQDIDTLKDYAPLRYTDTEQNTAYVTRAAMYSLLAELYLWRASDHQLDKSTQNEYYRKCIECCDWVIRYKVRQFNDNSIPGLDLTKKVDTRVRDLGYPLLAEEVTVGSNTEGPEAYNDIFDQGGSFETLFELRFNTKYSDVNAAVNDMYAVTSHRPWMMAAEDVFRSQPVSGAAYSDDKLFSVPSDYRCLTSFLYTESSGVTNIQKYVVSPSRAGMQGGTFGSVGLSYTAPKIMLIGRSGQPNWILYRLSEIMLFRAEAEIELAFNQKGDEVVNPSGDEQEGGDEGQEIKQRNTESQSNASRRAMTTKEGASLATADELLDDAFQLIYAVYLRSNPQVANEPKYAPKQPTNLAGYRTLLLNERRREFLYEGKRYFDLVRASRRVGNTLPLREALATTGVSNTVAFKRQQMGFMYMPVLRGEMKLNPNLKQNESYLDEQENQKN